MLTVTIRWPDGVHDDYHIAGLPRVGDLIVLYDDPGAVRARVTKVEAGPLRWTGPGYYDAPLKPTQPRKKPLLHVEPA